MEDKNDIPVIVSEHPEDFLKPSDFILVFERFSDGEPFCQLLRFRCFNKDKTCIVADNSKLLFDTFIRCRDIKEWSKKGVLSNVVELVDGKIEKLFGHKYENED